MINALPANVAAPLAGQPIEIMDGPLTEVVYAAWGTGTGTTISVDTTYTSGCKHAHSHTSTPVPSIVWGPKWVAGPGPAGLYSGKITLPAYSMSVDANGVVTVTVTGDNYVFEERHIGEYVTITATGTADLTRFGNGREMITGLGNYCTNAAGTASTLCNPNQFQYQFTPSTVGQNTNVTALFVDTVATFDYTEAGDSSYVSYGPGNNIPEIRGSVNIRDGEKPTALTVSAYDAANHGYYSSLFLGPGSKLAYANTTQFDLFSEAECSSTANFVVTCGKFHVRTGLGNSNDTLLGANGYDYYGVSASNGSLYRVGAGTPAVPDVAHSFTWTAQQTFSSPTNFTASAILPATGSAVSGTNYNSNSLEWIASVYNGSAGINDSVTTTYTAGTGSNPQTTLSFSRSSSNTNYGNVLFGGGFDRIGTTNKANNQTSFLNFANVNRRNPRQSP